jgi:DNA-binding transcriptional regulator YhcF (GntR family)
MSRGGGVGTNGSTLRPKLEENGLLYTNRTSGRFVTEDVMMIKQVKNRLAKEHVNEFLKKMGELGFEQEDILSIITKLMEEKKK